MFIPTNHVACENLETILEGKILIRFVQLFVNNVVITWSDSMSLICGKPPRGWRSCTCTCGAPGMNLGGDRANRASSSEIPLRRADWDKFHIYHMFKETLIPSKQLRRPLRMRCSRWGNWKYSYTMPNSYLREVSQSICMSVIIKYFIILGMLSDSYWRQSVTVSTIK